MRCPAGVWPLGACRSYGRLGCAAPAVTEWFIASGVKFTANYELNKMFTFFEVCVIDYSRISVFHKYPTFEIASFCLPEQ